MWRRELNGLFSLVVNDRYVSTTYSMHARGVSASGVRVTRAQLIFLQFTIIMKSTKVQTSAVLIETPLHEKLVVASIESRSSTICIDLSMHVKSCV